LFLLVVSTKRPTTLFWMTGFLGQFVQMFLAVAQSLCDRRIDGEGDGDQSAPPSGLKGTVFETADTGAK
jgi:hypothetical protein